MAKRIVFILLFALSTVGIAEAGPYNKPIYNKETKSYFELYNPSVKTPGAAIALYDYRYQVQWLKARAIAAGKFYKGVRGRLAVVKTASTHRFLRKHFTAGEPVWIGLRYWCSFHKLQWVTGEIQPLTAFQRWGRLWNTEGASAKGTYKAQGCEKGHPKRFLPVHYWSTKEGFTWNANNYHKAFNSMFIEYPTGKP